MTMMMMMSTIRLNLDQVDNSDGYEEEFDGERHGNKIRGKIK